VCACTGIAIVLIICFFFMGILAYYTYSDEPPIPEIVKSTNGPILFTRADVMSGQGVFVRNGIWLDSLAMVHILERISPQSISIVQHFRALAITEDPVRIQHERRGAPFGFHDLSLRELPFPIRNKALFSVSCVLDPPRNLSLT
jgi:hypothetical protein